MWLNYIAFNISWLGLVIIGNAFIPLVLVWLGLHLFYCHNRLAELKLIVTITLIGIMIDSFLTNVGILLFPGHDNIPFWLIALWLAFASTISHSLHFLSQYKKLQALIGFIFPPLSYIAGSQLSAVELGANVWVTFLILGCFWSISLMLFFELKSWFYFREVSNA